MLLAGVLTVSGLPITAIAADDTTAAVPADPINDAAWSDKWQRLTIISASARAISIFTSIISITVKTARFTKIKMR